MITRFRRWLGLHLIVIGTYVHGGDWKATMYKSGIVMDRVKLP